MADRTPAAWLEYLERRLDHDWAQSSVYDEYYEGQHYFVRWLRAVQDAFRGTVLGNLLAELTDNYMQLVVDAPGERLRVQGFRFGDSQDADKDAWRIWQANKLDAKSDMVQTEAIKLRHAFWLVQPNGDTPKITAEHPSQVIVATAPGDPDTRLAALKKWIDDEGFAFANIYLPKGVVKYRSKEPVRQIDRLNWVQIDSFSNPLGVVPIIPVENNPSMLRGGRSDLSGGPISLQNAITKSVADLLVGGEYHGLPQRVMLGVEPPRDPTTGRVISDSVMQKQRLWYFNSPEAKAHEFSQADLKALRETIDGFIGDLAAQTRIPIYYFRPQAISNISAEALIGLDAGLVSKTNRKKTSFGEAHEEMMRLAFRSIDPNDPRAQATAAETIWADTESRSQAQLTDAVSKEVAMGLPFEAALEKLGYSPQAVDRILAMREADSFLAQTVPPMLQPPPNGAESNGTQPALPTPN